MSTEVERADADGERWLEAVSVGRSWIDAFAEAEFENRGVNRRGVGVTLPTAVLL